SLFIYVIEINTPDKNLNIDSSKDAALTKKADSVVGKIRANENVSNKLPIQPSLLQAANNMPVDSLSAKDSLHMNNMVSKTDSLKKDTISHSPKDTVIRYFE